MNIPNRSKYINEYSKIYNRVPSPYSFEFESNKRNSYFQRLYWEFEFCKKVGGSTFFFTLTYNDKSIPKYDGKNVFNYDDIRLVTNGMLPKRLLRYYHASLKYFCSCESGEGKGKRGFGNNPHYHFIFFVEPADTSYKPVPVNVFTSYLKELWLGTTKRIDYRLARFGIVKAGKLGAEVTNPSAFKYVSKYVIKDVYSRGVEVDVRKKIFDELSQQAPCFLAFQSYMDFYKLDRSEFDQDFDYEHFLTCCKSSPDLSIFDFYKRSALSPAAYDHFCGWYYKWYLPKLLDVKFNEWRNKYGCKVRCSKGLGEYGLQFVQSPDTDPHFVLSCGKHIVQKPCLYYVRKLYYDTVICEHTGNILYRLNDRGIQLKMSQVEKVISDYRIKTFENISFFTLNNLSVPFGNLYDNSDLDRFVPKLGSVSLSETSQTVRLESFSSLLFNFFNSSNYFEILRRYSVYHTIYENRYFPCANVSLDFDCLSKDYQSDYYEFLESSRQLINYEDCSIYTVSLYRSHYDILTHPAFEPYVQYFALLDAINDFVFDYKSESKRQKFNESSEHHKRLSAAQVSSQYQ